MYALYGSKGVIVYNRQKERMKVYSVSSGHSRTKSFVFPSNRKGYDANMICMERILHDRFAAAVGGQGEIPYKALEIIIAGYEPARVKKTVYIF